MQCILRGTNLLLPARTGIFNDELEGLFKKWYPRLRPKAA
jgi:hypothetical protein